MANGKGKRAYSDAFKIQMVAESQMSSATVSMVSTRHGVRGNRIYAWRRDERFQGDAVMPVDTGFVEVAVAPEPYAVAPAAEVPTTSTVAPRIEITLENGRRLSIGDGVDVEFVLVLARGLAA